METDKEIESNRAKIQGILDRLRSFFSPDAVKKIDRVRVKTQMQTFWVKDPKKIKYWRSLAETAARASMSSGRSMPSIMVTKIVYR